MSSGTDCPEPTGYDLALLVRRDRVEGPRSVKIPETVQQLGSAGIDAVGGGPDDYARAIKGENERVAKAVQAAGIKPE